MVQVFVITFFSMRLIGVHLHEYVYFSWKGVRCVILNVTPYCI